MRWTSKRKPGKEPSCRTLGVLKGRSREVQLLPTVRLALMLDEAAHPLEFLCHEDSSLTGPLSWYLAVFIVEMFLLVFNQNFLCYLCPLPWPFPSSSEKRLWVCPHCGTPACRWGEQLNHSVPSGLGLSKPISLSVLHAPDHSVFLAWGSLTVFICCWWRSHFTYHFYCRISPLIKIKETKKLV